MVIMGSGRTMFDGVGDKLNLTLQKSRAFANGTVVSWYQSTES